MFCHPVLLAVREEGKILIGIHDVREVGAFSILMVHWGEIPGRAESSWKGGGLFIKSLENGYQAIVFIFRHHSARSARRCLGKRNAPVRGFLGVKKQRKALDVSWKTLSLGESASSAERRKKGRKARVLQNLI